MLPQLIVLILSVLRVGVCLGLSNSQENIDKSKYVFIRFVVLHALLYWGGWYNCFV